MSEETWTNRLETKATKDAGWDVEIKSTYPLQVNEGFGCSFNGCMNPAIMNYEIGKVDKKYFEDIFLCEEHNQKDTAWEVYDETFGI
jgi:hypothetical protein